MKPYVFPVIAARRFPDPTFKPEGQRTILLCRCCDLPANLPLDPNPRAQNYDKMVYRNVMRSLLNELGEPNTFHLKNKGLTLLAKEIRRASEDCYEVFFEDGQGIADGAHTYGIIRQKVDEGTCPQSQYVKVEILTGIPHYLADEIAGGLNTSVQVQVKSLANQRGQFKWIQELLKDQPYAGAIAYRDNEVKLYEIRDIIAILTLFNIDYYPNDVEVQEYPVAAYNSKEKTLERYIADEGEEPSPGPRSYRKLAPIMRDILKLVELIASDAAEKHTKLNNGKGGALAFVESRKKGHEFPFLGTRGQYRLLDGALIPTVGAFRYMVTSDPNTGLFRWRTDDGFVGVQRVWESSAGELMRTLQATSDDVNRNVNAMGKNRSLWSNLYNIVKAKSLEIERG